MCKLKQLVADYCDLYGLKPEDISTIKDYSGKFIPRNIKVYKGVHIDYMRMCLSYYFRSVLNQPVGLSAKIIGYRNHSTVSRRMDYIEQLILAGDRYILPYWENLIKLVDNGKTLHPLKPGVVNLSGYNLTN